MNKCVNGTYIDMTEEEIEEMKARMSEIPKQTDSGTDKRLEKLEKRILKLLEKLGIDSD